MPRNLSLVFFFALTFTLSGCDNETDPDAGPGTDGGGFDAGPPRDAGDVDSGPPFDAGDFDAGPRPDAGPPRDAGPPVDAGDPCASLTVPALDTEPVDAPSGDGWSAPIFLTYAPGADDLYVVEQRGRIRRVASDGSVSDFVDISDDVDYGGERGLLGMAFHPDYAANGRFFLYFTPNSNTAFNSHNHVGEYRRATATTGDPAEVRSIMSVDDPEGNHNGGMIAFGPDGFLYVGMGDGGGGDDRHGAFGNALNTEVLFGKILRLDVDNDTGMYAAAGNPFIGGTGDDRVWAYGIRNPWRFSFDRSTGDLYIGDVGQGAFEEIDFQPASSTGGENYGWRAYEGFERLPSSPASDLDQVPVHAEPLLAYARSGGVITGAIVTGGYVYRGGAIPGLAGWYLFADASSGDVAAVKVCGGAATGLQGVRSISGGFITSFGEDRGGELYLVGFDFVRRIIGG